MASEQAIIASLANNPFLTGKGRAALQVAAEAVKSEGPSWVASTAFVVNSLIVVGNVVFEATAIAGTGTSGATEPDFGLVAVGGTIIDNPGANQITWTNKGERTSPRQVYADRVLAGQVNYPAIMPTLLIQLGASAANDYGFDETAKTDTNWNNSAATVFEVLVTKQLG